jgi:hypothetical protein
MAGIDMHKRIEALERIYGQEREHNPERERLIEELKARWPAFEEKMAHEEAEGRGAGNQDRRPCVACNELDGA